MAVARLRTLRPGPVVVPGVVPDLIASPRHRPGGRHLLHGRGSFVAAPRRSRQTDSTCFVPLLAVSQIPNPRSLTRTTPATVSTVVYRAGAR